MSAMLRRSLLASLAAVCGLVKVKASPAVEANPRCQRLKAMTSEAHYPGGPMATVKQAIKDFDRAISNPSPRRGLL